MPTESDRFFGLVVSGVGEGGAGVVLYGSQNVSDLMFKKKLLPLITELIVILKYLGVIHLWRPQNMTICVTPNPLHLQKWTIDLLFKNKKNLQTLDKF